MNTLSLRRRPLALSVFLVLASLHLFIVLYNHYHFRTFAYYYGVYNFAFYDFAHFSSTPNPVLFDGRGATFMQDHFSLLLPVLSPLYWVFAPLTGTYTLLILQWIAILLGAWGTYRFVSLKAERPWLPLAAMFCYFIMYSRFASYVADCNLAIIGASLVPLLFYFFAADRRKALYTLFAILLITREDFSLWLFFVALFLLVTYRKRPSSRKTALIMAGVSLAYFAVVMTIVIPALETPTIKFLLFNYTALGENSAEALRFIFAHPFSALKLLFVNHTEDPGQDGVKGLYYFTTLTCGGLLLFLRPATLLCFLPVFAKKMYNDDPLRWSYESYYGVETASLLPALVFYVIADLESLRLRAVLAITTAAGVLATTAYSFATSTYLHVPFKAKFYESAYYQQGYPVEELREQLALIPAEAGVCTNGLIIPQVAFRRWITHFPDMAHADYVCINLTGDAWPVTPQQLQEELQKMRDSGLWEQIWTKDNLAIFRRKIPLGR